MLGSDGGSAAEESSDEGSQAGSQSDDLMERGAAVGPASESTRGGMSASQVPSIGDAEQARDSTDARRSTACESDSSGVASALGKIRCSSGHSEPGASPPHSASRGATSVAAPESARGSADSFASLGSRPGSHASFATVASGSNSYISARSGSIASMDSATMEKIMATSATNSALDIDSSTCGVDTPNSQRASLPRGVGT